MERYTVALVGANHGSLFKLVEEAQAQGICDFYLFGVGPALRPLKGVEYYECDDNAMCARLAIQAVIQGDAQILMKGLVQTHELLHEVLKKENGLRDRKVLSHVARVHFNKTNQTILLTDAAMNIEPSVEQRVLIIENAVDVAHKLKIAKPKVALLSAAENYNAKMPSSVSAKRLQDYFEIMPITAIVEGPISLDLALSVESSQKKHYQGAIQGDADIIVVPTIDVGNGLYKAWSLYSDVEMAGIICGAKVPIALTSRSDSLASKMNALKFALSQLGGH